MNDTLYIEVTTQELCEKINISISTITDLIEHGIVEPVGPSPDKWLFDPALVSLTRRATRLHRDLGIDWNGVALILELLEERDSLKAENAMLQRRLDRFLAD